MLILWLKVSRLNDDEMKRLVIDVVDRTYRFIFIHTRFDENTRRQVRLGTNYARDDDSAECAHWLLEWNATVRERQYGLTVERVWGFIVAAAALMYSIGYSIAAVGKARWFAVTCNAL